MEPKSTQSQEMIHLVTEVMNTIECGYRGKENSWYKFFGTILERLNKPHSVDKIARDIISVYGGMGTFNDLVLHKNQITMLQEENDKLEQLRHDLYILCEKILTNTEL
ncbi:hypothetical protein CC99x_012890 [Candidatus Berkiella cookevillensis]|uniref:DUF6966 domain-containing protein n=1 Tax=Candidatus Berkiella cookevillensis TaxID=437022 RepID=A0A0Q9YMM4_9GAMM|nr:hypothetical protein [Candidatus Berkiella cookevillensis]MCS5709796.1 hypothetical protein [Candidatus Berkiella cookevillensis]